MPRFPFKRDFPQLLATSLRKAHATTTPRAPTMDSRPLLIAVLLAYLSVATVGFGPDGWRVQNNTNLRFGDIPKLDFKLPATTNDSAGISACTAFCEKNAACAAWVYVRAGTRCAIKGYRTGWCTDGKRDPDTIAGIRPGVNATNCSGPSPTPPTPPPPPSPSPPPGSWRLPAIDWKAGGIVGPTDNYAVRAFDVVFWAPEGKWYLYCDLVLYSDSHCPSSFGSEIGVRKYITCLDSRVFARVSCLHPHRSLLSSICFTVLCPNCILILYNRCAKVFSANSLDDEWTYHGTAVPKNATIVR